MGSTRAEALGYPMFSPFPTTHSKKYFYVVGFLLIYTDCILLTMYPVCPLFIPHTPAEGRGRHEMEGIHPSPLDKLRDYSIFWNCYR